MSPICPYSHHPRVPPFPSVNDIQVENDDMTGTTVTNIGFILSSFLPLLLHHISVTDDDWDTWGDLTVHFDAAAGFSSRIAKQGLGALGQSFPGTRTPTSSSRHFFASPFPRPRFPVLDTHDSHI